MGDGLNLYTYCNNNPVYYLDPSGNVCITMQMMKWEVVPI